MWHFKIRHPDFEVHFSIGVWQCRDPILSSSLFRKFLQPKHPTLGAQQQNRKSRQVRMVLALVSCFCYNKNNLINTRALTPWTWQQITVLLTAFSWFCHSRWKMQSPGFRIYRPDCWQITASAKVFWGHQFLIGHNGFSVFSFGVICATNCW